MFLSVPLSTLECLTSLNPLVYFSFAFHLSRQAFYQPDPCSDDAWLQTYVTEATVYMQRFFSRINSFVKIEPVQEELKCDQQSSITVHYILNEESYTADTTVYFHYIVSATLFPQIPLVLTHH